MEKSIETIWKEGFLKSDALVAPKLNNLYNQKSGHIVDKFKRMFKINLRAILIGAFVVLLASFLVGIPVMGALLFPLLIVIVIVNKKLMKGLEKIDKNVSSYEYLKTFDNWLKQQMAVNTKMARFYYPYIFLSLMLGFWFTEKDGKLLGELAVIKLMAHFPDTYLVFGIPLFVILGILLVMCLLAYFGGRIYQWDVNIVYGRIIKKLDEIIADMEALRS